MALSCHRAPSPAAASASLLFRHDTDHVNLWERADQSVPLPACSSSDASHASGFPCHVCVRVDQVYAFCRNLLDGVGLVMEGTDPGSPIDLEKIDCPVFPTDSPPQQTTPSNGLVIAIVLALLAVLIVAGFVFYHRRYKAANRRERESHNPSP